MVKAKDGTGLGQSHQGPWRSVCLYWPFVQGVLNAASAVAIVTGHESLYLAAQALVAAGVAVTAEKK